MEVERGKGLTEKSIVYRGEKKDNKGEGKFKGKRGLRNPSANQEGRGDKSEERPIGKIWDVRENAEKFTRIT